uniref:Uncharacterized protein n=1 Tax=Picea glauca TaxID=3330 RepID=A0A124GND5_PICGL|nr:hypothetical protein ABT39_MTgene4488 [Picea glauca]
MQRGNAGSLSRCQVLMPRIYTLNAGTTCWYYMCCSISRSKRR